MTASRAHDTGESGRSQGCAAAAATRPPRTLDCPANSPFGVIMTFIVFLILIVGGVLAYRYRVPLIAKITGQKETRIRRALEQRKRS